MKFASSGQHRSSVLPSGSRTIQVDDLCSCCWISSAITRVISARDSPRDQHFSVIVHHCRCPITKPVVAIPHRAPSTGASNIKVSGNLAGPGTEHLSVRCHKHVWIERQRQVSCSQIAPGCRRTLPYLRLDIDTHRRIYPTTDHQHVSVRQRGVRWIPPSIIHVRQSRPTVVQRVIRVSIDQPHIIGYVSTGYQELSIRQKGMA